MASINFAGKTTVCWLTTSFMTRTTSKTTMMRKGCTYTYVLLSLAFIVVNIATLGNLAPWTDEVMFLDTSYNMAVHGSWETTAWYRTAGQYPFSTYPPLYQLLATAWIWLFGGSLVVVRSLNLLITFVLGGACLQLMRHRQQASSTHSCRTIGLPLTPCTVALFTLLLWGTSEMAWMYRNGRPDMLCALLFVFAVKAIDSHLTDRSTTTRIATIATSALLVCSGFQAAAYLLSLWLFLFIVMKGRRKEALRLLVLLLTGLLLGVLFVAIFMLAHGRLMAFACSILPYSATLSALAVKVLPWAGDVLGIDATPYTQKLLALSTHTTFTERLASIVDYRSFLLLAAIALAAYASNFRDRLIKSAFLSLLFALYVPVVMTLAGRFPIYYRWMAFLPLLFAVTMIAARQRLWRIVFSMAAVAMTVVGIRSVLPNEHWNYANLQSFVRRQHFRRTDAVVCPFSVFYAMKPVCGTCYFAGIFPTEFIGHVDYIIEAHNGDECDQSITDYVGKLRADSTLIVTAIDSCENPAFTLYHVQSKHE